MLRFLLFLFWLFSLENKQSSSHDASRGWLVGMVWYGTNREGWRKVVGDGGAGVGCDARRLGEGIVREPH